MIGVIGDDEMFLVWTMQVLTQARYRGQPADVWSCGVILYVRVHAFIPAFSSVNEIGHTLHFMSVMHFDDNYREISRD